MRGLDLEPGSYYMCTETSPRCFVIQQVNDVDNALKEVQSPSSPEGPKDDGLLPSPPPALPLLPWWFTPECKQRLMSVQPQLESGISRSATPDSVMVQMTSDQLRARLKKQLEYYFSRGNLMNDRYLHCQMDADLFVPIKTVAGFARIAQLTNDYDLIVEILRTSDQVQVDEAGERVRPSLKRCTIFIRERDENEVKGMFDGCPQQYEKIINGLNNSWYVSFGSEEDTNLAFLHLKNLGNTFNGKPIHARIKTGGAPVTTTETENGHLVVYDHFPYTHLHTHRDRAMSAAGSDYSSMSTSNHNNASKASFDLVSILAQHGYRYSCHWVPHASPATKENYPSVSVNVPISIHTNFTLDPMDHLQSPAPPPSHTSMENLVHEDSPKETLASAGSAKKRVLDQSSAEQKVLTQSCYDGGSFLLSQSVIPTNLGRQRITDVPRMNKTGRRSPLMYTAPMFNGSFYYNQPFCVRPEDGYAVGSAGSGGHKQRVAGGNKYVPPKAPKEPTENTKPRLSSNFNTNQTEHPLYYPRPQHTQNYSHGYNNPLRTRENSSGFNSSDNRQFRPNRGSTTNSNTSSIYHDKYQRTDYGPPQPQPQSLTQALRSQSTEMSRSNLYGHQGEQKPWAKQQHYPYSRNNSYGSTNSTTNPNNFYSRQLSAASTTANWRRGNSNEGAQGQGDKENDGGKQPAAGMAKPLSSISTGSLPHNTYQCPTPPQPCPSNYSTLQQQRQQQLQQHSTPKRNIGCDSNTKSSPSITEPTLKRQKNRGEEPSSDHTHPMPLYNFVEVEFPSLAVEEKKLSSASESQRPVEVVLEKRLSQPTIQPLKQHRVQFSAVVAGVSPKSAAAPEVPAAQECVAEKAMSYAQTLKKHKSSCV